MLGFLGNFWEWKILETQGKSQEFLEIVKYANTFDISRQLNSLEILEIEVY